MPAIYSREVRFRGLAQGHSRGFSLVEIMVVLGAIAVLVGVLVPSLTNILPTARDATSMANLEELNQAVLRFNQANWELVLDSASDSSDEIAIARSLQFRAAARPAVGSPYLEPTLSLVATESDDTYRAFWNGRMFQMLSPGTDGTGLDLAQMHAGGSPAEFDNNYQPVGAP